MAILCMVSCQVVTISPGEVSAPALLHPSSDGLLNISGEGEVPAPALLHPSPDGLLNISGEGEVPAPELNSP